MSTFWSIWVTVIVLGTVFGCWWLLWATRKGQTTDTETDRTVGHAFDGIEEYDNPLPKWWFYLFIATCVFALGYLALYPGLGYLLLYTLGRGRSVLPCHFRRLKTLFDPI